MKNYYRYLILALIGAINMSLHMFPGYIFEYHRDELLYFSLCNHLDFGYATTPPLVAYLAFLSKSIFGYSVFSVRFFPALFSGFVAFLTAMIAKELKGGFKSQVLSAIGVIGSLFLVTIFGVFTPYFSDVFFWTLIIFLIIKFINSKNNKILILLGITIGFSVLNKYNVLFLITAILLVIPFTIHRKIFTNKFFYYVLFLALIIASPNIIWQITHHFPVINHMKELKESQLDNVTRMEFIIEQLIFLLPFTFIVLPGIIFFLIEKQLKEYRFLISVSGVVLLLFLLLKGKSFYTAGLFPFLIVAGALFLEKVFARKYLFFSVAGVLVILSALLLPLGLPLFKPIKMVHYFDAFASVTGADFLRKDEDGNYRKLPQVYADMLGWNEIAEKTSEAWMQIEDKNNSFIFCANYGQAGAISVIGNKYNLPEPLSFSESFQYWLPKVFENEITELVYIIGTDAMDSGNFKDLNNFFNERIEIATVENPLAIEYGTKIYLFRNPKSDFNEFWKGQTSGFYL
jgi:hypothetical protein